MKKFNNNVHSHRQPMAAHRLEETLASANTLSMIGLGLMISGFMYFIGRRVGILEAFAVFMDAQPKEPQPEATPRRQRVCKWKSYQIH